MDDKLATYRVVPAARGWDWIVEGFSLFKQSPGIWIAITVIWVLMSMVCSVVPLGDTAMMVFTPVLFGGLMMACADLRRGEDLEIGHLFAGFQRRFAPLLLLGVILTVAQIIISIVLIALLAMLGAGAILTGLMNGSINNLESLSTTLIGAGIGLMLILIMLWLVLSLFIWFAGLIFSQSLVGLGNMQPVPALRINLKAAMANWQPLLVNGLIGMVLGVMAIIPLMLGLLVLIPVFVGSTYAAYRDVFADLPEQLPEQ